MKFKMKNGMWLLIFPMFLMGENFDELVKLIDNSNSVKIYEKNVEIEEHKLKKARANNFGKVDISYGYNHLFEEPVIKTKAFVPAGGSFVLRDVKQQMGEKNSYLFEIRYSYPIFTGFLISNLIKGEKLKVIREKLKVENLKRDLVLKSGELYSKIYALKSQIKALQDAKKSLMLAREKGEALFKEGLINRSNVDEIVAKYYEIEAKIAEVDAEKKSLLNNLSYILNKKIASVGDIENVTLKEKNFQNRPDVKILKNTLNLADIGVKMAKSNFYPKLYFAAGLKKEGDNVLVDENSHRNVDNSYLGLKVEYSINGQDREDLEVAKLNKMKSLIAYRDYLNRVESDYKNDILMLKALKNRLNASLREIEARKSYYDFIASKFSEGLADSVDLNSAVSKLAEAKAKRDYVKSEIFFYTIKANVDGGGKWRSE